MLFVSVSFPLVVEGFGKARQLYPPDRLTFTNVGKYVLQKFGKYLTLEPIANPGGHPFCPPFPQKAFMLFRSFNKMFFLKSDFKQQELENYKILL